MAQFPSPTSKWHSETYSSLSPTRPEVSAKGKTIIITGGGTGIGAETARYFAEAGASRIALLGRREQPLLDTKRDLEHKFAKVEVFVRSTDVTSKSDVDASFSKFLGNGKVDVVVSNAAVQGPTESVKEVDGDKLLASVQQNLGGSLNIAQAFLRYATSDAVAIEVNSGLAHLNVAPAYTAYSVSKLAVFRLWDAVAFANPGMSVFHIQPGIIETDMSRQSGGIDTFGAPDSTDLPASFMVWLASPEAQFLKGKYLWANWDVDELKARAKEIEATSELSIGLGGWPFQDADRKSQVTA